MSADTIARYTAGPWEVVKHTHIDDELWLSVNQHADAQGMKEWIAEIKYLTTDPERQWANARLIAAAPTMYRELKLAADTFRNFSIVLNAIEMDVMAAAAGVAERHIREQLAAIGGAS